VTRISEIPTRIFSYGCLAPLKGQDLLEEQLRRAHTYKNTLIGIERRRRESVQEAIRSVGDVGPLATRVDELETALSEARTAIRAKRAREGRRADTAAESERARAIVGALRTARTALREAKQRVKGDQALRARIWDIEGRFLAEVREARASCGVYWGTYLQVEAAVGRARKALGPPRFLRYDGTGKIAVRIRQGMTVDELFGCQDTRIRIRPIPADTYSRRRHHRRLASRTVVSIRAGTEEGSRLPLWIEFPVILHRPLPTDARIKWAWVLRRKIGLRYEYRLQFVLESESFRTPETPAGKGTVALDLGWRNKPDGGIRVAYWLDDTGASGEVLVPARTQLGLQKPDDLRAIRDKAFDAIRLELRRWLKSRSDLPGWLRERIKGLEQWRSQARLAALLREWRSARVDGDASVFSSAEDWAKQDRHLLAWEAHQRDRRLGHRKEEYRRFAVSLANRYATIVLEKFDLRPTREAKPPEEGTPADGRVQRRTARIAAPGELRAAIKAAAEKHGARIVEIDAPYTTQTCSYCGCLDQWNATSTVMHSCAHCGATWDQDDNACRNLLALAGNTSEAKKTTAD